MPRLLSTISTVPLLVAALSLTGCGTIYTPVFSPNKKRYIAPPQPAAKADTNTERLLDQNQTNNPSSQSLLPPITPDASAPVTPPPSTDSSTPTIPGIPPLPMQ